MNGHHVAVVGGDHDECVLFGGHLSGLLHGVVELQRFRQRAAGLGFVMRVVNPTPLHLNSRGAGVKRTGAKVGFSSFSRTGGGGDGPALGVSALSFDILFDIQVSNSERRLDKLIKDVFTKG